MLTIGILPFAIGSNRMETEKNILDNVSSLHFTGIGGIGMSALAEILNHLGYRISGSDLNTSPITERLESLGISVEKGNCAEFVDNCDLLVYTAAVKPDNPELAAAKEKGIPAVERADLLGCVQRKFAESVAVAGTHGKTTVTSMISLILLEAGYDPTICAGGVIPGIGSNARAASGDWFVCEACEYVDSFLRLSPKYSVITNVEHDHTDYFPTIDDVIASFAQFIKQTTGPIIINGRDENALKAIDIAGKEAVTFGLDVGDYHSENIEFLNGRPSFDVIERGESIGRVKLAVPGLFNVENALAAIALARTAGVEMRAIISGLYGFTGAVRRFQLVGTCNGADVFDDYAHHPHEMFETLKAAKMFNKNRVICVFQPHTYSRTESFKTEMADALSLADVVLLAPIYAARETNTTGISSDDIAELIPGAFSLQSFSEIADYIRTEARPDDMIIIMGAGDINAVSKMIINQN